MKADIKTILLFKRGVELVYNPRSPENTGGCKMIKHIFYVIAFVLCASAGFAQTGVQLSPANHDRNAKVVALGDNVSVDLETNIGTFEGNARISQGELRISADKIILSYDEGG